MPSPLLGALIADLVSLTYEKETDFYSRSQKDISCYNVYVEILICFIVSISLLFSLKNDYLHNINLDDRKFGHA